MIQSSLLFDILFHRCDLLCHVVVLDTRALHGAPVIDHAHAIPMPHAIQIAIRREQLARVALIAQKQLGFFLSVPKIDAAAFRMPPTSPRRWGGLHRVTSSPNVRCQRSSMGAARTVSVML
jgi:hypothetical protein